MTFGEESQNPRVVSSLNEKQPLSLNPLSGLNPISNYKIFDVFYEGEDSFRVFTAPPVPNMAYLYAGEQQIARVALSPDNKSIQEFHLAGDISLAQEILDKNPQFPFRAELEQMIEAVGQVPIASFEFKPSAEVIQTAARAFQKAFTPENFMLVPAELIGSILRDQPDAVGTGLHIAPSIEGLPNPMLEEYFRNTFGWLLGNGYEIDVAQKLALECVYDNKVLITNNLQVPEADLEQRRLALHEGIHLFFVELSQFDNPQVQILAKQIKQAYTDIPFDQKAGIERLFDGEKYTPRQRSEEFWTYYLSALAYPPPKSHPLQAILELGQKPIVQKVTTALSFLTDINGYNKVVPEVINKAKRIESKK